MTSLVSLWASASLPTTQNPWKRAHASAKLASAPIADVLAEVIAEGALKGDLETAIEVFKLNVEAYPEAYDAYDSLGEVYMEAGNHELAIKNYQRTLELNPGSENAKKMLRCLGVEG